MKREQKEIVYSFRVYLSELGYSDGSVYMLPNCIADFLSCHPTIAIEDIGRKHIESYYDYLHIRPHKRTGGGLSGQYISHHIHALKVFFAWLERGGQIKTNPISAMRFVRHQPNSREPLTQKETALLFESCATLKEKAVLHLFYSCGLRQSEGEGLQIKDIDFKERRLYVRNGKGAKRRVIALTAKVAWELEEYFLKERNLRPQYIKDAEAFMLNKIGKRMSGAVCNKLLKELIKRAGLEKEISLHHLRHSIATHLLENGMRIEYVRDFLGHSRLESTQVYAKVSPQQLQSL